MSATTTATATAALSQQFTQLADSLKATNALINRLSTLTFPPGAEPAESESNPRIELSQDIHENLKHLEQDLELLTQEAADLAPQQHSTPSATVPIRARSTSTTNPSSAAAARLNSQLTRLATDLRTSRTHFRRAQLAAKKSATAAQQHEREALFAQLRSPPPDPTKDPTNPSATENPRDTLFSARRKPAPRKPETELTASTSVTAALRRTHALLSTELTRSRYAQETFDESTAALETLGEQYSSLDSVLGNSRALLGTLLRSQKSDTWYLETAFWVLCVTLGWLVFRRLLWGPFIKLPLFLVNCVWFLVDWVLLRPVLLLLGLFGVTGGNSEVAASASAAASGASSSSLIIQPSAGPGGFPKFDRMAQDGRGGVPVGAGGAGAKKGPDGGLAGEVSEGIGRMAEQGGQGGKGEPEVERRGDGTVLREREEGEKPNPKKRVLEEPEEEEGRGGQGQGQRVGKRDEL